VSFKRVYWVLTTDAMGKEFEIVGTNFKVTIHDVDMLMERVHVVIGDKTILSKGQIKLIVSKCEVEKHVNANMGRTQQWKPM
jgi:hypothetical protein